jgi:hypothetical protein
LESNTKVEGSASNSVVYQYDFLLILGLERRFAYHYISSSPSPGMALPRALDIGVVIGELNPDQLVRPRIYDRIVRERVEEDMFPGHVSS